MLIPSYTSFPINKKDINVTAKWSQWQGTQQFIQFVQANTGPFTLCKIGVPLELIPEEYHKNTGIHDKLLQGSILQLIKDGKKDNEQKIAKLEQRLKERIELNVYQEWINELGEIK